MDCVAPNQTAAAMWQNCCVIATRFRRAELRTARAGALSISAVVLPTIAHRCRKHTIEAPGGRHEPRSRARDPRHQPGSAHGGARASANPCTTGPVRLGIRRGPTMPDPRSERRPRRFDAQVRSKRKRGPSGAPSGSPLSSRGPRPWQGCAQRWWLLRRPRDSESGCFRTVMDVGDAVPPRVSERLGPFVCPNAYRG